MMTYCVHKKIASQANFYSNKKLLLLLSSSALEFIHLKMREFLHPPIKNSVTKIFLKTYS